MHTAELHFAVHLFTAVLFGSCVGLERQLHQRMAGTRTNALVAAGAAAFVMAVYRRVPAIAGSATATG